MKDLTTKRALLFIALSVLIFFIGLFQNCAPVDLSSTKAESSSRGGGGSSDGFEGKPYFHYLPSGTCDDGSQVKSQINSISLSEGQLVRDDCKTVPTDAPQRVAIQLSADRSTLTYLGNSFILGAPTAYWLQKADNQTNTQSSSIQSAAFLNSTTTGTTLVCAVSIRDTTVQIQVTSVQDSAGNQFSLALRGRTIEVDGYVNEIWYASGILGGTSVRVTAQLNGETNDNKVISCHEYAGLATARAPGLFDVTSHFSGLAGSAGLGADAFTFGPFSTTSAAQLAIVWLQGEGGVSIDAPFLMRSKLNEHELADRILPLQGSFSVSGQANLDPYDGYVVTFQLK